MKTIRIGSNFVTTNGIIISVDSLSSNRFKRFIYSNLTLLTGRIFANKQLQHNIVIIWDDIMDVPFDQIDKLFYFIQKMKRICYKESAVICLNTIYSPADLTTKLSIFNMEMLNVIQDWSKYQTYKKEYEDGCSVWVKSR